MCFNFILAQPLLYRGRSQQRKGRKCGQSHSSSSQGPRVLICWHTPAAPASSACVSPGASFNPCASETIAEQRKVAAAPSHPVLGKGFRIPAQWQSSMLHLYMLRHHARDHGEVEKTEQGQKSQAAIPI